MHNNLSDVVESVLSRGVDVDKPDSSGITALISAAVNGFLPILERLIRAGANLDIACHGSTTFHAACHKGHVECAVALVKAGCNVSALDNDYMTDFVKNYEKKMEEKKAQQQKRAKKGLEKFIDNEE